MAGTSELLGRRDGGSALIDELPPAGQNDDLLLQVQALQRLSTWPLATAARDLVLGCACDCSRNTSSV